VDALRQREALLTYIEDVRKKLQRHTTAFAANLQRVHAQARSLTLARA